jgi:glycosyltransferase involved in cell wall biosynthesis
LVIEALKHLPDVQLAICGEGPWEGKLRALVRDLQLSSRVHFLGRIQHEDLPRYYSAADVLALMPAVEGYPNVLLEALACGTPVVATNAGGISEIVTAPEAGRLIARREATAIAEALAIQLRALPSRASTRAFAEQFDWDTTIRRQIELYGDVLRQREARTVTPQYATAGL